jgi:sterol desaturase/sphingolipid hydroxylase (fatty acid hydroxylase superfamily)
MSFEAALITNESPIRLGLFASIFVLVALWESLAPRRTSEMPRRFRWTNNLALAIVSLFLVRALLPLGVVGLAVFTNERGIGLLNAFAVPYALAVLLSLLVFDLMMYLMHVMFHAVPALWNVHRVHHSDTEFDLTTGLRFHPIQMVLTVPIKFAVVLALGPPVLAVLIFEVLFSAVLMFSHANVRLPARLDRVARWFIVTPDMHRVHHSVEAMEANSNFGFALPWWDRMFGTYLSQPAAGYERMAIGVDQFRAARDAWLDRLLLQPFHDDVDAYPINRRWDAS